MKNSHTPKFGLYTTRISKSSVPPLTVIHSLTVILNALSHNIPQLDKETRTSLAQELAAIVAEPWDADFIIEEILRAVKSLPPELD